ncbi:MAG: PorV/PorQ family protein [candidate division KSB1 bacterium]|nr:PorV/PorQ family protein [candidate division KSB1 bacterium]MDZ7303192.1 PorV/PorQ family protein [candidate division KSB1 bacterium]MDZ7312196.1 PorV/PorQ family protein [candidate division KSB1 bacterium]
MKKLFVFSFAIIFILVFSTTVHAQLTQSLTKVGTTAAQFLKIGAGVRAIAMGGAFVAVANDVTALYWNPAGIATIPGNGEATFTHAEWLAETAFDFAAVSLNAGSFGTVGLSVTSFRVPEDLVRTHRFPEGTGERFDASSIALAVSYARMLTDRFAIGFTGKFVQEQVWNETAQGVALDFGTHYVTPFKGLRIGAAITNFGTKMQLEGRDLYFNYDPLSESGTVNQVPALYRLGKYELPLTLRLGLAYDLINDENLMIMVTSDAVHPNDNSEYLNSGMEVNLRNLLYLRGGYKALFLKNSEQGLTFGAGLRYDAVGTNLKIDFGYADYGRLKNVQFVAFTVRF